MSVSVFEALENADYNLQNNGQMGAMFAKDQLHNAVELIKKGYNLEEEVEPLLDKYGSIDQVPEKEEQD